MATPKSKNVLDVSDILAIEENKDPVQVPVGDSKLVTFPDIFDMPVEEAERLLRELNRALTTDANITPTLKRWLPEDDVKALMTRYPSYRKLATVVNRVVQRYESSWGSVGEDLASES